MPYLKFKTPLPLEDSQKQELCEAFAKAIGLMSGKNGDGLLMEVEGNAPLWMGRRKLEKGGALELTYFGKASNADLDALNAELFDILNRTLGLTPEDVYLVYQPVSHWGVRGICVHGEE